jgi:hypothetical protein
MIPQLQPTHRRLQRPAPRPQSHGRMKEQRSEDYEATPAQIAGATARRIIREMRLPDTKENWRAISGVVLDAILPDEPQD